ncbi:PRTRC system protein F (plasmid) [Pararobbsia alpina]|uniref:PRTRC system protein F n=1 Tax=Pararobbsia alpina TaxID=621374 RepID=UPI0039A54D4C
MLFDPQSADVEFEASGQRSYERASRTATEHRPAAGFLSVPKLGGVVPNAVLRRPHTHDYRRVVFRHFQTGVLRADDVTSPVDAGDAFAQAFHAWLDRECPKFERLEFQFVLLDAQAVRVDVEIAGNGHGLDVASPLYLGLELSNESFHSIGDRVDSIRRTHPRLMATAVSLIDEASRRTVYVRTPDEFLDMFARWYWNGSSDCTDEEATEELKDRFGEDFEEFHRYMPSAVRPILCPDDARPFRYDASVMRWRKAPVLGAPALERLSLEGDKAARGLCRELLQLKSLLAGAKRRRGFRNQTRNLFGLEAWGNSLFPAATLAMNEDQLVGQLLDDHYNCEMQGGEYTYFQGFAPFATEARAIRRQFADWRHALRVLGSLDRVLTLISS